MAGELKCFTASDGSDIFYREWEGAGDKGVLVYLHGIESHTGWFIDTADKLSQGGFIIYALERRGSGVNKIDRGHVDNYQVLLDDLTEALKLIKRENLGKKVYLMGLCWGGKLAVTLAAIRPDLMDGLILVTPAIKTKIDLSLGQKINVAISNFIRPRKLFDIPIEDSMFTKNPKYLDFIKNDDLKLTKASARFFFEAAKLDRRISGIAGKIKVPILLLLAGNDRVVDTTWTKNWFTKAASEDKSLKVYEGSCHSLEFEDEAKDLVDDICRWVDARNS